MKFNTNWIVALGTSYLSSYSTLPQKNVNNAVVEANVFRIEDRTKLVSLQAGMMNCNYRGVVGDYNFVLNKYAPLNVPSDLNENYTLSGSKFFFSQYDYEELPDDKIMYDFSSNWQVILKKKDRFEILDDYISYYKKVDALSQNKDLLKAEIMLQMYLLTYIKSMDTQSYEENLNLYRKMTDIWDIDYDSQDFDIDEFRQCLYVCYIYKVAFKFPNLAALCSADTYLLLEWKDSSKIVARELLQDMNNLDWREADYICSTSEFKLSCLSNAIYLSSDPYIKKFAKNEKEILEIYEMLSTMYNFHYSLEVIGDMDLAMQFIDTYISLYNLDQLSVLSKNGILVDTISNAYPYKDRKEQ